MAPPRPTQRELAAARQAGRRAEMECAIAEGRLTVRKMTALERQQSEARFVAAQQRGAVRKRRRFA